eukprot:COSAG02_NODE_37027_length_447_cov_1.100575_1_plen_92_part_10
MASPAYLREGVYEFSHSVLFPFPFIYFIGYRFYNQSITPGESQYDPTSHKGPDSRDNGCRKKGSINNWTQAQKLSLRVRNSLNAETASADET